MLIWLDIQENPKYAAGFKIKGRVMKQKNEELAKTSVLAGGANMLLATCFTLNRIIKTAMGGNISELASLPSTTEGITLFVVNVAMFYSFYKTGEEKRPAQNMINGAQNQFNNLYSQARKYGAVFFGVTADTKKIEAQKHVENNVRNANNMYENIIAGGAEYFDTIQTVLKP